MDSIMQEILKGLTAPVKRLPCKLFYDRQGLILYNEIMSLPEYYLVNSDLNILKNYAKEIITPMIEPNPMFFSIVDLGAGNGLKTRILLQQCIDMQLKFQYMPIDIDASSLSVLTQDLSKKFPMVYIEPKYGDYFEVLKSLKELNTPKLLLFLGSSIGNYTHNEAIDFFTQLNASLNPGDKLLVGFDLIKDPHMILSAYDDKAGITRKFNLNLLARMNHDFDANFDLNNFIHYPTYDPVCQAAHSYLISTTQQTVYFKKLNMAIDFNPWEPIHTETSHKYHIEQIAQFATKSHFHVIHNFYDDQRYYVNSLWSIS